MAPSLLACRSRLLTAFVATVLLGGFVSAAAYQSQPPVLSDRQRRSSRSARQVRARGGCARAQGKTAEAIRAAESMLAIEREVLGKTSDDAIRSVKLLAQLHEESEDWAAARQAWTEVLTVWSQKLGKAHPDVIDATGGSRGLRPCRG